MREVLQEDSQSDVDANSEESSGEEGVIKMDFTSKSKTEKPKQGGQGITALKFMQKSEQRQKEQIKAETQYEIDQINQQRGFVDSANKFGSKLEIKQHIPNENTAISE